MDQASQGTITSELSGSEAVFRLSGGEGLWITIQVELSKDWTVASDIVFRYFQRLAQVLAGTLGVVPVYPIACVSPESFVAVVPNRSRRVAAHQSH